MILEQLPIVPETTLCAPVRLHPGPNSEPARFKGAITSSPCFPLALWASDGSLNCLRFPDLSGVLPAGREDLCPAPDQREQGAPVGTGEAQGGPDLLIRVSARKRPKKLSHHPVILSTEQTLAPI